MRRLRLFAGLFTAMAVMAAMASGCGADDDKASPLPSSHPESRAVSREELFGQGAFLGAGGRIRSDRYVMDFALGQSTQNQEQSTSTSYLVRGGLIGANGRAR